MNTIRDEYDRIEEVHMGEIRVKKRSPYDNEKGKETVEDPGKKLK